ncbi:kinase-like domain-containing protein [Rhizophagus diaphanus]|nr:kinase-like domain-containing protein [Rhizophagus diaphanus] [Rhizophagus sp. MUCL 43196]
MLYLSKLNEREIKWIPHFQIENEKEIAQGGFSIIYKATYRVGMKDTDVVLKKLRDSQNISKYFLNELKSLYQLNNWYSVINCYGITQDPITKEYMFVMEYANGGDLHGYLQNNFIEVSWKDKLSILRYISLGLMQIHKINFVHRDLHSGNILLLDHEMKLGDWKISDLGLSQPTNTLSNNEIYGVMPYIAPEIFKGFKFSKESDVYSLGMIMWELTTGCKPFANIEHNYELVYEIIDGKRPEITNDTPECYANLMKKCWDSIPLNRPTIDEFWSFVIKWFDETSYTIYDGFGIAPEFVEVFEQAEEKRIKLIRSKKLGPGFSKKSHSKAIYTSRKLNSLIYKSLTTDSSPMVASNITKEYITKEYDYDINMNNIQSSQNINSDVQSSIAPLNSSRKRNIKELKIDTQK